MLQIKLASASAVLISTSFATQVFAAGAAPISTGLMPGAVEPGITSSAISSELSIPEVTVTAQKKLQYARDVPISMTVVDEQTLTNTHANTLSEMQQLVPNLSIATPGGNNTISLRGVGGGGRNIGFDTRVGIYLDGVYVGQSQAVNQSLFDIQQVEVLRGPQGYLFGRNSDAGAINITTRPPSDKFEAYYKTSFASYRALENYASVTGPISDGVQGKLALGYASRDGFGTNLYNNDDIDGFKRLSMRAQISFQPSARLNIDVSADHTNLTQNNIYGELTSGIFGAPLPNGSPPAYTVNIDTLPYMRNRLSGVSLKASYDLAAGSTLTAISAYRTTHQARVIDDDFTAANIFDAYFNDSYHQASQEIRLTSSIQQPLRYGAGVYLLHEIAQSNRAAVIGRDTGTLVNFPPIPAPVPFGALFGVAPGAVVPLYGHVETRSYAVFGTVDYDLTDALILNIGGRYTVERKKMLYDLDGSTSGNFGIATVGNYADVYTDNHFSPMLGMTYKLDNSNNAYVKYASGFKSGGWNMDFITPAQFADGIKFNKETVDSYEFGLKGSSPDRGLQYDIALFLSNYQNYQVFQSVNLGQPQSVLQLRNAAHAQSKGLEASLSKLVTDRLTIGSSIGLLDAVFKDFPQGLANGQNAAGKRLPEAPEFSAAVTLSYTIPAPWLNGKLVLYGEESYRSRSTSEVDSNPATYALDSRNIVNLRASYISRAYPLQVSLFASNLLDEHYIASRGVDFLGNGLIKRGEPRMVGLQARYDF